MGWKTLVWQPLVEPQFSYFKSGEAKEVRTTERQCARVKSLLFLFLCSRCRAIGFNEFH